MNFNIEINDLTEILSYETNKTVVSNNETTQSFQISKGNISFKEEAIRQGLTVFQGFYNLNENILLTAQGTLPLLEMHFNLSPKSIFQNSRISKNNSVNPMSGNLIYVPQNDDNAKIGFSKHTAYHTFDVHLPTSILMQYEGESKVLDDFLKHVNENRSTVLSEGGIKVNPKIYNTIEDIRKCVYSGLTRKVYIESKVFELLAMGYESVKQPTVDTRLSDYDTECVCLARQIILENIDEPCSIIDLSRMVGINQTKLKEGFKAVFGTTVFGYLQEIRMKKAKKYLLETNLSVQEISVLSGYNNQSNFSIAFKRTFGYSPIELRKSC